MELKNQSSKILYFNYREADAIRRTLALYFSRPYEEQTITFMTGKNDDVPFVINFVPYEEEKDGEQLSMIDKIDMLEKTSNEEEKENNEIEDGVIVRFNKKELMMWDDEEVEMLSRVLSLDISNEDGTIKEKEELIDDLCSEDVMIEREALQGKDTLDYDLLLEYIDSLLNNDLTSNDFFDEIEN